MHMASLRSWLGRVFLRGAARARPRPEPAADGWVGPRRLQPISRAFGGDRGLAICHYYIKRFLDAHRADVRGRVLEFGESRYTREFGDDRVSRSDVLHAVAGNPQATLVGDLTRPDGLPLGAFDCVICTQTLPFIYDVRAALGTLARMLRPGGVLLATFAGISQISRYDMDRWGDYWRFTDASARKLFAEHWPAGCFEVATHGNVLVASAYLYGLASDELRPEELSYHDPDYQVLITVRAVTPSAGAGP